MKRRRARQSLRFLRPLAIPAVLCTCVGPGEYSTAEMLPPLGFEAGVHAAAYWSRLSDGDPENDVPYHVDWTRPVRSAGASAAIGLTERTNLLGSFDYGGLEGSHPKLPARDARLALALKWGLRPSREALSMGLAYHPGLRVYEVNAAFYFDRHMDEGLYYCFAPVLAYYGGRDFGFDNVFPHAIMNQSLTWYPSSGYFLRPQVGVDLGAFIADVLVIDFGMAIGF